MSILKQGEINAIVNNFEVVEVDGKKEARIGKNSIHLASNHEHRVSLRTNGLVVYGVYYNGEQKIRFTHDFVRYPKPFVADGRYIHLKDTILKAWEKTFDDNAKAKLAEVKAIVDKLLNNVEADNTKANTTQAPQINNTNTKKEEVNEMKEMKNNTNTNAVEVKTETKVDVKDLHVMKIAHIIRKELKLEGHYYVQMKIAMNLAWRVKKGFVSLEGLIAGEDMNTNTTTKAVEATHTYNTADTTEETVEVEQQVKESVVSTDFTYRIYLKSFKDGVAQFFMRRSDGAEKKFYATKARNLVDLDKQFAKVLGTALQKCYDNTTLEYYGQYTYLTFCNTEGLREYAGQRNITLSQGVAPSGDAA